MTFNNGTLRRVRSFVLCAVGALLIAASAGTLEAQPFNVPTQDPKVNLRWDRYYDYDQMVEAMRVLQRAYPRFLTMESIGKSWEGRDLWLMTVNNPATGHHTEKAAFWVDGNIHGNEIQGSEVNLYLIWFLMENYDALPKVREMVDTRAFYILPSQNPDGRVNFFETGGPSRSGMRPFDSDGDGRPDSDSPNDLTGNREILQMRKYVPGEGTHIISPVDPRLMVVAPRGERGDYIMLGSEGIDVDGDGRRNEDARGGYDMNRDWPSDWQPPHIQGGAFWYPFAHPETRALGDFLRAHPNIAAAQSWHNSGGMILRGPGSRYYRGDGEYPRRDVATYDYLGKRGELILPYYRYMTIWKDLYTVYGGQVDWIHDGLGIFTFTNELWSTRQLYNEAWTADAPVPNEMRQLFYNDHLGMGSWWVDWQEIEHPELGTIEVGGWSKWFGRTTPPFMLQEMLHRNAMFALFHADEMPLLEMDEPRVERISGNTYRVRAEVRNIRAIPSRTEAAEINRIGDPDYFRIAGPRATIQAGGFTRGELSNQITLNSEHTDPAELEVLRGVPGHGRVDVTWIVTGSGPVTVSYESMKGGKASKTVQLR
jgi:hypothetical protein